MYSLTITTQKKREVIDITEKVQELVKDSKKSENLIHIFVTHTTAALTLADLDPGGTDQDYLDAFEAMTPKLDFRHPHDPSHMPDHILSSLIGTSLSVPVETGNFILGTWQRIILIELDGPRERRVVVSVI